MPNVRKIIVDGKALEFVSKTDPTLTQENIPGDAKSIGTMAQEINTKISNLETEISLSQQLVVNANTHYDFPSVGSVDVLYKAYKERKTYQWNAENLVYEPLNEDNSEINLINGGNANGA